MQFLKRSLTAAGGFALLALFVNAVAPKQVHAAVATLVQVANTISNPAITQDTSKAASQIVNLACVVYETTDPQNQCVTMNSQVYTVPSNQSLVITSITVTPFPNGATGSETVYLYDSQGNATSVFSVGAASVQFALPAGQVFPPGAKPTAGIVSAYGGLATSGLKTIIFANGYLTAN